MARGGIGIVRRAADTQRQFRGRFTLRSADELVDAVPDCYGLFCVTAGQFSLGDWAWAWLERLRTRGDGIQGHISRALVSVWALGDDGVRKLSDIADEIGGDAPIRLLIDPHQAGGAYRKHLDALAERLGRDSIRLLSTHAKLVVFEGTDVVLSSSANLSGAPRSETMLCVRDQGLADDLAQFWGAVWTGIPAWGGEDKSLLGLRQQLDVMREAAEKLELPAVTLAPAAGGIEPGGPGAVRPALPPADAPGPPGGGGEPEGDDDGASGGQRGDILKTRRTLRLKLNRPRQRTVGELAQAAKALRELDEAEAGLGGVDVELAREVLAVATAAIAGRSYRERAATLREGVARIAEAITDA